MQRAGGPHLRLVASAPAVGACSPEPDQFFAWEIQIPGAGWRVLRLDGGSTGTPFIDHTLSEARVRRPTAVAVGRERASPVRLVRYHSSVEGPGHEIVDASV